jgi:maltose alpha-D-glucosyltransferase/alpha-amylase
MKRVIAMRKRFKAFSRGDIQFLTPANAKVLTFTRTYENETILVIANLSRFAQAVELDLDCFQRLYSYRSIQPEPVPGY